MDTLVVILAMLVLGAVAVVALAVLNRHLARGEATQETVERALRNAADWCARAIVAETTVRELRDRLPAPEVPEVPEPPARRRRNGPTTGETATVAP